MRPPNPINLAMVGHVAERLGRVRDSVVFVGGAVVDLLITDPAAPSVRPTKDVDVIVEVASLHDYYKIGDLLRALGFKEDSPQRHRDTATQRREEEDFAIFVREDLV